VPPIAWLVVAIAAGVAGYLIAWPAWISYRAREARDLNADRYLAWRGRASRPSSASTAEGMTGEERRRVMIGAALAVGAVLALVAFFATT
jgi:hypothetical protein